MTTADPVRAAVAHLVMAPGNMTADVDDEWSRDRYGPIESVIDYPTPEPFPCACGKATIQMWWNGGELDDVRCKECGRQYQGKHIITVAVVRPGSPTEGDGNR